jgi:hypothetical protein
LSALAIAPVGSDTQPSTTGDTQPSTTSDTMLSKTVDTRPSKTVDTPMLWAVNILMTQTINVRVKNVEQHAAVENRQLGSHGERAMCSRSEEQTRNEFTSVAPLSSSEAEQRTIADTN